MSDLRLERRIIIGLIVSTEYIQLIRDNWNTRLLQSPTARTLANWCIEYYDRYGKAPFRDIESIYEKKIKKLNKDIAQEIEEDILPDLSEEYEHSTFNVDALLDDTKEYFLEKSITQHTEYIQGLLNEGKVTEAEKEALNFQKTFDFDIDDIDLSDESVLKEVESAFSKKTKPLFTFPRQLGKLVNDQLVRDAFVAFMGREKVGKTWNLMEMAMRANQQGSNVAFFQAGDMTKDQQLRRIGIYDAKKSDSPEYCGKMWEPIRDCVFNQLDTCDKYERTCDFGIFDDKDTEWLKDDLTLTEMIERHKDNPDYSPCTDCPQYWNNKWGAVWIKQVDVGEDPITEKEVKDRFKKIFIGKQPFKLSSHPNKTLSISTIKSKLSKWKSKDNFIPDVIIIDYADIMISDNRALKNERDIQNDIWKDLRGLSQEQHCLVITATQADAKSYKAKWLQLENFSEDKRKYAHATVMYGQNKMPWEEEIGIMRLNEIVKREGKKKPPVTILQNLQRGRPFLGSY
jgi:hypothetical protein